MRKTLLATFAVAVLGLGQATPEDTFVFLMAEEPDPLEPTQIFDSEGQYLVENVYESLVGFDQNGEVIPRLATSWERSPDGLRYTFTLREGVPFHTGNTMRCEDAEYSFRRLLVTNDGSSGAFMLSELLLGFPSWDDEEGLTETTPYTAITDAVRCDEAGRLEFNLLERSPSFLERLTNAYVFDMAFAVEDGEWSGTEADWRDWIATYVGDSVLSETSAGTNAYRLLSIDPSRAVFTAFGDYWGGAPALQNVIVQIVPDANSRGLAIRNGDADAAEVSPELVPQLRGAPGVELLSVPSKRTWMLVFNQQVAEAGVGSGEFDGNGIPPDFFSDRHVRRGFAAAFDAQRIVDEAVPGTLVTMALPSFLGGDDPSIGAVPFDLELAERELRRAWEGQVWEQGFALELWYYPATGANDVSAEKAAQVLKEGLEALNPKFRVTLVPYNGDDYYEQVLDAGSAPIFMDNWIGDYPTLDWYLDTIYHTERPGYYGSVGWTAENEANAAIDDLLDRARSELEPEVRSELYREAGRIAAENALLIMIPEPTETFAYREELEGFAESFNLYHYGYVQWQDLAK